MINKLRRVINLVTFIEDNIKSRDYGKLMVSHGIISSLYGKEEKVILSTEPLSYYETELGAKLNNNTGEWYIIN